jgi:hypothetical protein
MTTMTTIVSGFITNINSYRNIEKYIEFGKKLCKININKIIFIEEIIYNTYFKHEIYESTTFIFTSKEQLYLYKYNISELINFNKLCTDNTSKDTFEYMFVQNNKTEWIREAIDKNPYNTSQFIWIDFGIFHIINDDELFNKCICNFKNKSYENIRIGSSNFTNALSIYTNIHWLFLGGIFGGNSKKLIEFADLTKKKCIETIHNKKTIMWEVNIWYLIYLEKPELFDYYIADHNTTMLIKY